MINESQAKQYCGEDVSLIENYAEAVNDKTQVWDIHHKLEIMPWGTYTVKNLKDHGLYYGQPAASLVFLTHAEHMSLHRRNMSEETKRKLSEANKGRPLSDEHRLKISEAVRGEKNHNFGRRHSEEAKRKMSEAHKGRPKSEETRRRMSEARKAYWKNRREQKTAG